MLDQRALVSVKP